MSFSHDIYAYIHDLDKNKWQDKSLYEKKKHFLSAKQ